MPVIAQNSKEKFIVPFLHTYCHLCLKFQNSFVLLFGGTVMWKKVQWEILKKEDVMQLCLSVRASESNNWINTIEEELFVRRNYLQFSTFFAPYSSQFENMALQILRMDSFSFLSTIYHVSVMRTIQFSCTCLLSEYIYVVLFSSINRVF